MVPFGVLSMTSNVRIRPSNAPIFDFAHYGIVGNAIQVLPELTAAFRSHLELKRRAAA